jgi:hypothetical protein
MSYVTPSHSLYILRTQRLGKCSTMLYHQLPGGIAGDTLRGHLRYVIDEQEQLKILRRRVQQECQPCS